jgi:hypothetical protein
MPSVSDHVRRDAEHAARSDIRVQISRFIRRMDEQAKAHIQYAIERAEASGEVVDGLAIGREAAARAIGSYMDGGEPQAALDSPADDEPDVA